MTPTVSKEGSKKRIAYIKNGDVVEELKALAHMHEDDVLNNGGPYHYIGSFLKWTQGSEILLISFDIQNKRLRSRNGTIAQVINTKRYPTFWRRLVLQINAFIQLLASLLCFKPTWLICTISTGAPLAACFLAAKFFNIPFVHSRHMRVDHFNPSFLRKLRSRFDYWLVRKADAVLCNGPYLKDQLLKIKVKQERIIQYGLPYKDINDGPGPYESSHNDCRLLYVGRVEEKKGALDLLVACRPLLQNSDAVSLTYIGHGQFLDKLIRKTKEFGLEKKVFFLGQLQHSIAIQTMRNYDVLIVPTQQSLGEGRCKTVIEGLLLGIPIIAPDYGAFRYLVIDGGNGLFYEPDNIDDLSLKISYLVDNAAYRTQLGKNAKKLGNELKEPEKTFLQALEQSYNRTQHYNT